MDDRTNDEERLAMRLFKLDPEKFVTLCRMHLSFILDLDSESLEKIGDCNIQLKEKIKKSFAPTLPKKPRIVWTKDEETITSKQSKDGRMLYELIDFLGHDTNLSQEGLFRKSGKISRQEDLYRQMKNGGSLILRDGDYSVHDCAGVLKRFLSELPEPLLTEKHYLVHCQLVELCQPSFVEDQKIAAAKRQIEAFQLLNWLLPSKNRNLLRHLLSLLHEVDKKQAGNKMDAVNLATLFAPHILCPRQISAEEFCNNSGSMIKAVTLMIENAPELFKVPEGLARDLKVLWNSKVDLKLVQNKSNLTPEAASSPFDEDAITTVTTFCDRQPVGQENTDATSIALAQLYAHVQTLPESSKKKQLIKQFNKENGNGTPLCHERQRNHQRSRSLKKSIKKHLFGRHKRHRSSELLDDHDSREDISIALKLKPTTEFCTLTKVKPYDCGGISNTEERNLLRNATNRGVCKCEPTREQEDKITGCSFCRVKSRQSYYQAAKIEDFSKVLWQPQANLTGYRSHLNARVSLTSSSQLLLQGFNPLPRNGRVFKETSL